MPNSYRIRTDVGTNKVLQVNLDQDYDKLEILSLSIFPNEVYTRSCADYGVICGRVFANRGLGLVNARVSVFIPISEEDQSNPIISTLYPYRSFEDFNEDGYKYNLLPYSQSYSGHVPVGTFPDRIDALTNPTVVEVYDKYYKFTAKTNDSGDFMIFGVPVGQYELFMQVDLSDIGEFSLSPQDLIRMGRAVESQVNGTKFKFSENYSELPQIVTLTKTIQVAPFYGEEGICQHYIVRADFDLTTEASIELKPVAIFMGSLISTTNKKKLKRNCKVPAKQGWLCDLISGPGQIECIRQTIFTDDDGRPILEEFRLENEGKLIDANGAWVVDVPMNLDYEYTDENGIRRISPDGSAGVPTRARYRFKIKWQQSTSLREEDKRGYFLVPNVKEWGWSDVPNSTNPNDDPAKTNPGPSELQVPDNSNSATLLFPDGTPPEQYYIVTGPNNISEWTILVNGIERPDLHDTIPLPELVGNTVVINYTLIDSNTDGGLFVDVYNRQQFQVQGSYAYSLSWADYGTSDMIQEAVNCEDRFFEFTYNKVYTVSQLIDRFSSSFLPQKSIQIKYVNDEACEDTKNPFPVNDAYYRYSILFIFFSFILEMFKFILIPLTVISHVLGFVWIILTPVLLILVGIINVVIALCEAVGFLINGVANLIGAREPVDCPDFIPFDTVLQNPFKNIKLPLFLYTDDGCTRCRCDIDPVQLDPDTIPLAVALDENASQFDEVNVSNLANLTSLSNFSATQTAILYPLSNTSLDNYKLAGTCLNMNFNFHSAATGSESEASPNSSNQLKLINSTMQAGWNSDENLNWVRLPIFEGNDGSRNIQRFSLSLTLAERLNLFNTKAKYFDNVTAFWDGNKEASISPGNTGWNQIKITWNPGNNDPATKFHFDNVMVLVVDSGTFNRGDLLTFQDPNESQDPNVNDSLGVFTRHTNITISYANPNFQGSPNSLQTTYIMPSVGAGPESITGTTCYPMDIEYFQVIDSIPYDEYILETNHIGPNNQPSDTSYASSSTLSNTNNSGDAKFSLPYRFLRSNVGQYRYYGHCNGCDGTPANTPANYPISNMFSSPGMSNANRTYTKQRVNSINNDSGFSCNTAGVGLCFDNMTWTHVHLDDWNSIPSTTGLTVVFLQRGVDPNSQTIPIRFDLRRLYGSNTDFSTNNNIRKGGGGASQVFSNSFVNQRIIFTVPGMKMNIPIKASPSPLSTANPKGLRLPYHEFYKFNDTQAGNADNLYLFYGGYNFRYLNTEANPFFQFETKMHMYYSALSKYSRYLHGTWNSGNPVNQGIVDTVTEEFAPGSTYEGILCASANNNAFTRNLVREIRFETDYPCYLNTIDDNYQAIRKQQFPFAIPAAYTVHPYINFDQGYNTGRSPGVVCDDAGANDGAWSFLSNCYDGSSSAYVGDDFDMFGGAGTGRYCTKYGNYPNNNQYYHSVRRNTEVNDVSGYYGREYVEGGSVYVARLTTYLDYSSSVFFGCPIGMFGGTIGNNVWINAFNDSYDLYITQAGAYAHALSYLQTNTPLPDPDGNNYTNTYLRDRDTFFESYNAIYFSPVYAGFEENVPVAPGYSPDTWHVNPNNRLLVRNPIFSVFRTDRLPSSTQITKNGFGNTMLLHQNAGFAIFKLANCTIEQVGGGDVNLNPIVTEVDVDFIPGGENGEYSSVLNSVSQCEFAVDLNSYYINTNGTPGIADPVPYSTQPAAGSDYVWFERGRGCYVLVSKVFISLFRFRIDETNISNGQITVKYYSDIRSVVEWVQRLKLTFAMCFDIFSQTFSNNWINGTLYAFSFQMATFFNDENQPFKSYCRDTIFFNRQIKNFFYRSSPYNGNNFIGKLRYNLIDLDVNRYGNLKNLLFPTTIMDLGPKNQFIQEIVFSDEYDGYIVDRVPSTSYKDNSKVLNLFVLSRFVNVKFWQLLIPVGNSEDDDANQGSDDPSIRAVFTNSRWANGNLFFGGLLPSLVDADFSQMISISSEFGVYEYGPETYGNNTIYFGTDGTGVPFYGLFFSGNTVDRDYITPRRTLYNPATVLPITSDEETTIPTFTQEVPFYQWRINMRNGAVPSGVAESSTIFGQQSNDFQTNPGTTFFSIGYQDLDRLNFDSEYFRPSTSNNISQYYNAFISNNTTTGALVAATPTGYANRTFTFGSPQHFYFGLIPGATAMDVFINKYVDTTLIDER